MQQFDNVNEYYLDFIEKTHPEKIVMGFLEKKILLSELKEKVDFFTSHLINLGIKTGSLVGITIPNCPEAFYLTIAISRLGACSVPLFQMIPDMAKVDVFKRLNTQLVVTTSSQLSSLKDCSIKQQAGFKFATIDVSTHSEYQFTNQIDVKIEEHILQNTDKNLPLMFASSSGTTGIPKRVILTQENVAAQLYCAAQMAEPLQMEGKDSYSAVIAFPLSTAGMITCLGILFSGVLLIYSQDISTVKFLGLISQWKADSMAAPPSFYEAILSLPILTDFDLSSIKRVQTGMDFFTQSLQDRLKQKFSNIRSFANGYGLVETSNIFMLSKNNIDESINTMKLVENIGNVIEIRDEDSKVSKVGSEGELYVKGPSVIKGYIQNNEENEKSFKDGWFKTGDIVRNEGNNCITLLGRKKYLIKRGGKSVSPIVVADHINKLDGIKNSAVVGVPHPLYGEMIWAFVVTKIDLQLKDIMKHCRAELANYMTPDQVTFIKEIPIYPGVGKINFELLKEMANKELSAIIGGNND